MEEIKVVFTFNLENGNTYDVSIKDLRNDLSETELVALGNKMVEKNGQFNGSKFISLKKCERIVTNKETFDL